MSRGEPSLTGLPASLRATVQDRLGSPIRDAHPVSGGCIHDARLLELEGGSRAFLKWGARQDPEIFVAEAEGLDALRVAGAPRLPQVLGVSAAGEGPGWLLLEYIAPGRPGPAFHDQLAVGLASIHRAGTGPAGWHRQGWIGPLDQDNRRSPDWPAFWRDRRLLPQLERAHREGLLDRLRSPWPELLDRVEVLLAHRSGAARLHGDLWSGNVFADGAGEPVLIDPAVYHGDALVDLAMAYLFGGFAPRFFRAYYEAAELDEESERERALYQLYPLLVHVNLFGGSYVRAALRSASLVLS
ncbi:MAG: fructosamine kinase family protein [Gemmatimonadota bacterium]